MATELQLVVEANSELLAHAKVANPRGCSIHVDKHIQKPVLIMKGTPSQTRVQVPREDRPLSSLRLHNSLLAAQICLNSTDHFAVEIVVSQYTVKRTKLIIGTNVAAARYDKTDDELTTAYLPLIIPRNKWVQVVFHVAGIVHTVFNLPCITCIDAITLTGTGKISCVFTSSDEQSCIAATPEGMALFAVPAYVPPIWKTAAATPEHLSSLLNIDSRSDIPLTSDVSFGTAAAPCAESPSSPASPLSTHSVILPRLKLLKETAVPPSYPHVSSSASEQVGAALGKGSYSAPSQCDYIRLVDNEDIVAKDEHSTISCSNGDGHRQQASQDTVAGRSCGAARGAANSTACGLSGWEQFPEERVGTLVVVSPARLVKVDAAKRPPRKPRVVPGPPGSSDNERLQRIIASRKHRVMPRQGSLNSGGDDGRSNISRRQQRLRRRMRVLRANEQKANKTAAAKALVASELPLSQRVAAVEDSTEAAPICGYGFGYLGVLKPNGEYEEDDDANLNLEGALTLLTDNE
ncbi:hypothetical protein conserved [Leishmania donovani]|uniref:Hypothetical_protein_conserved n=1 Tax=Leishmania donovani TaxID=5661 RepID=A0A504XWW3_LEIDO|nr:hypothetical protein CGC20_30010 [Leishmania donovani]CAJ1987448.1 hypothetical protein conserved [Leishmania donovani]VDZ43336.1 hypothetical_protein_conserved [Leishmania donovani]